MHLPRCFGKCPRLLRPKTGAIHSSKPLTEKLARSDPLLCGSGRRFQEFLCATQEFLDTATTRR